MNNIEENIFLLNPSCFKKNIDNNNNNINESPYKNNPGNSNFLFNQKEQNKVHFKGKLIREDAIIVIVEFCDLQRFLTKFGTIDVAVFSPHFKDFFKFHNISIDGEYSIILYATIAN